MAAEIVPFPKRWRLGVCKNCRRALLVETDQATICPHCGAVARLEWQWVDLAVTFEVVKE